MAKAAYISAGEIFDDRVGRNFKYTNKSDLIHTNLMYYMNDDDQRVSICEFWNANEAHHKRKDATVAREFEIALPNVLSEQENVKLAQKIAKEIVIRHGVAAHYAVHRGRQKETPDQQNMHVHILCSSSGYSVKEGFGKKCKSLDPNDCKRAGEPTPAEYWRERVATIINEELEAKGIQDRVDHRSNADRGITRPPQLHLGPAAAAMQRKHLETRLRAKNWSQQREWQQLERARERLRFLDQEIATSQTKLDEVILLQRQKPAKKVLPMKGYSGKTKAQVETEKAVEAMTETVTSMFKMPDPDDAMAVFRERVRERKKLKEREQRKTGPGMNM